MLHDRNENLSKPDYQWSIEAWEKAVMSPWTHHEVALVGDLADWTILSQEGKQCIAGLLKGFTLLEQRIGCYWRTLADTFPKADISAMCSVFSAQETIHGSAYNALSATLGLDEYEAFLADPIAQSKLAQFSGKGGTIADNLALFSGAGEYVSLFASFLLLLSYCKTGQFKGLRQILSWSVRDEQAHATAAAMLFKEFCIENEDLVPTQQWIAEMLESAKQNELAFVANAFANANSINGLTLQDIELFINHRCNEASVMLGYDRIYKEAKTQAWFDLLTSSNNSSHNDFFAGSRNGSAYSAKLSQDFGSGLANFVSTLQAPQCNLSGQCL